MQDASESQSSSKRLNRRQYIKYAGAGAAAAALAGVGCYGAGRLGFLNRAPIADFEYVLLSSDCPPDFEFGTSQRALRYIRANSEEEITFSSNCLSDHYSHMWHVDDKIIAETSVITLPNCRPENLEFGQRLPPDSSPRRGLTLA